MSTLRVSNIEAKADASSPSVNEKVKVTNSNGDVQLTINGETAGITTVGVNTTGKTFDVNADQKVSFVGEISAPEASFTNVSIAGTITYDDVTNVDSIGIVTARSDLHLVGTASSVGIRTDQPEVSLDASQATDAFALENLCLLTQPLQVNTLLLPVLVGVLVKCSFAIMSYLNLK